MVGSRQRVLIESLAKRDARELAERTANNRVVNYAGPAELLDRFAEVIITEARAHSLRGRLPGTTARAGVALAAAGG